MRELNSLEENRKFCHHDITHLIEVARIMLLINEKEQLKLDHDIIVATALLHDLGRVKEYTIGTNHRFSSLEEITEILRECTYQDSEINIIIEAISLHNNSSAIPLANLLYRADKLSRPCYLCKAKNECYWDNNIKNKRYYK